LAAYRQGFLRQGVYYPRSTGGPVAQFLHRLGTRDQRVVDFRAALLAELQALPEGVHTVVLSAEQCSFNLREPAQIAPLQALLAPLFPSIRVAIYLRRQDLHTASLYAQALRRGLLATPSLEGLESQLGVLHHYDELLARWGAVFGQANVLPMIFEPATLHDGDAVTDFFLRSGLESALPPRRARMNANPSMNSEGQALLRGIGGRLQAKNPGKNINDALWHRLHTLVTETCPGRGWQPQAAEAEAFMARFADGNEKVRARYFPSRATLFEMSFIDPQALSSPGAEAAYDLILAALNASEA
jgi:hypothetical protein